MLPDQRRSLPTNTAFTFPFGILSAATEYVADAAQRKTLFWDVMPQRGNQFRERLKKTAPHVLEYEVELVTGRTLDRMVNYARVRVIVRSALFARSEKNDRQELPNRLAGVGPKYVLGDSHHGNEKLHQNRANASKFPRQSSTRQIRAIACKG
jgi:hypothetical protein